jgi:hypothetical protein
MEDVGTLNDHLVYFTDIWYVFWPFGIPILWLFGIFSGYLVYFLRFGMMYQEKSGNPGQHRGTK